MNAMTGLSGKSLVSGLTLLFVGGSAVVFFVSPFTAGRNAEKWARVATFSCGIVASAWAAIGCIRSVQKPLSPVTHEVLRYTQGVLTGMGIALLSLLFICGGFANFRK